MRGQWVAYPEHCPILSCSSIILDVDAISDRKEKEVAIGIINNFGQTPLQLFKKMHPPRNSPVRDISNANYYSIEENVEYLIQGFSALKGILIRGLCQ
jgi:hypothetical protein